LFVEGRRIVASGQMVTIDTGSVIARQNTLAKRLWERM